MVDATPVAVAPESTTTGQGCDPRYSMENGHVKICFEKYGDKVWIKDKSVDGRSAMGELYVTLDNRHEKCRNSSGAGRWGYCNYNFGEGHAVSFEGYTLDHEGAINIERDHTGWKSECSGSSSRCNTSVPDSYPNASWPNTLKDYCTRPAADSILYPSGWAQFHGPCARHDICYHGDTAKSVCDSAFRDRMYNVCDYTFPRPGSANPTGTSRRLCHVDAQIYYEAVKVFGDG